MSLITFGIGPGATVPRMILMGFGDGVPAVIGALQATITMITSINGASTITPSINGTVTLR